jgi:hypothetical protein
LQDLLWVLERADDSDQKAVDNRTRHILGRVVADLRSGKLLALLVEDTEMLAKYCRSCGTALTREKRGRPPKYCVRACRQKGYRLRGNPNLTIRTEREITWLAEIFADTVAQMAQAESRELEILTLRSQMQKVQDHQESKGTRDFELGKSEAPPTTWTTAQVKPAVRVRRRDQG